jgi:O-antigen/teichoic acid export membrane protein
VRLVVGGAFVAAVVFAVLWFNALATWIKVLSIVGVVVLVALWWLWTRRHEIRAEMERREARSR